MKKWLLVWSMLCFSITVEAQPEPDDYVVTLVRHGDRSPRYPLNSELWPMGVGEMTDTGFKQCYEAGKSFRKHQLPAHFPTRWSPGLSYHQARGMDRTIQCAATMLQAIYPDSLKTDSGHELAVVPPVYAPFQRDDPLLGIPDSCKGYRSLISDMQKSPLWIKKAEAIGPEKIKLWAQMSGQKPTLHGMSRLADTLNVRKIHNIPLPDFLTTEDEQQLLELMHWFLEHMSKDKRMVQLTSQPLLNAIDQRYKQHKTCLESGKTDCEYFYLLSASDNNILAMLSALGNPRALNVPYASRLTIRFSPSKGVVQASFNDQLLTLSCGSSCTLEQWSQLVASIQRSDWTELCHLQEPEAHSIPSDISTGSKKEK
ncbi:histidine phosphatase family protein [Endozoicomonas numazuensis]|uniref:Acid phosphatase n=1 Tax=Endozoicomonas numazuensis TaxID=1137799 RepID=A0A081NLM2_9GAMM|nr:histidine phosphatase family protein [Endozoicomonas numazuensis]KEQ19345.1 hypothetical protein GZ78_05090 [Endozoicomonas numazuensis]